MNLQLIFIIQIILSVLLVVLILLQSKGTGLGSAFGEGLGFYGTKRGAEKMFFMFTIIIATLFLLSSMLAILL